MQANLDKLLGVEPRLEGAQLRVKLREFNDRIVELVMQSTSQENTIRNLELKLYIMQYSRNTWRVVAINLMAAAATLVTILIVALVTKR